MMVWRLIKSSRNGFHGFFTTGERQVLATSHGRVIELPALRNQVGVFRDRAHAGEVLASMLSAYRDSNALVLGIPAGGAPVAAVIARVLALPLDMAVLSKLTLPWNTEAGYGALAFDGTLRLNTALVTRAGLSDAVIETGKARAGEGGTAHETAARRPTVPGPFATQRDPGGRWPGFGLYPDGRHRGFAAPEGGGDHGGGANCAC
jgi:hypothetical protein